MEQCTTCETAFRSNAPLILRVSKPGNDVQVHAQNNGQNILIIKRMKLCLEYVSGSSMLYIREGGFFDFYIGGERLEQGLAHMKFRIASPAALRGQAEAEYIEITGRSQSCLSEFSE